jgi:hypothetical protein
MNEQQGKENSKSQFPTLTFVEFLESSPPYHPVIVSGLWDVQNVYRRFNTPDLSLDCEHETCQGIRFFEYSRSTGGLGNTEAWNELFLEYKCKNCEQTRKSFSLLVFQLYEGGAGLVVKLGEWPPFGPKTPTRLLRLLGADKDLFLRGRRAECHGLGLGAFTYYRRVVENQKNRLLDEIIKVVKKVGDPAEIAQQLENAKQTFQFSQAVDDVKLAIPQVLLIDGHNPLTLLHSALSSGIHGKSDDECLELAKSIRLVLVGLAQRLGQALSEHKELTEAVSKLLQVKSQKGKDKDNEKSHPGDA